MRNVVLLDRAGIRARKSSLTLAHELGHVLMDLPGHPDDYGVDTPTLLMDSDAADASPVRPAPHHARRVRARRPAGGPEGAGAAAGRLARIAPIPCEVQALSSTGAQHGELRAARVRVAHVRVEPVRDDAHRLVRLDVVHAVVLLAGQMLLGGVALGSMIG